MQYTHVFTSVQKVAIMQPHDSKVESDPRYCPSDHLLRAMHRVLLLCPVLGLPNEYEELCIPISDRRWVHQPLQNKATQGGAAQPHSTLYTWKVQGSRYDWEVLSFLCRRISTQRLLTLLPLYTEKKDSQRSSRLPRALPSSGTMHPTQASRHRRAAHWVLDAP